MMEFITNLGARILLSFLKHEAKVMPDGTKGGLFRVLTRGANDTGLVENRITTELGDWFKVKPVIVYDIHHENFLADCDIKDIVENYIGANNWEDTPIVVHKAFFKSKHKVSNIPVWGSIIREGW